MKSNKIQWLQKMGIDVWRSRTVELIPTDSTLDKTSQETESSSTQPSDESATLVESQSVSTSSNAVRSNRSTPKSSASKQDSGTLHTVQINVCCSSASGLLLINDSEAIDRDFSDDIFRAYRLLKGGDSTESETSFLRFNWPERTRLSFVKGGNDSSLVGARRAFIAAVRTAGKELPGFVIAIGEQAIQLTSGENFGKAKVLHCVDEPDPRIFKMNIWTFLRDEQ